MPQQKSKTRTFFRDPLLLAWLQKSQPQDREACRGGPRPCPHISCENHLYFQWDNDSDSLKLSTPGKELWELESNCSLDQEEQKVKRKKQTSQTSLNVLKVTPPLLLSPKWLAL